MCVLNVRVLSRVTPKYFGLSSCGMFWYQYDGWYLTHNYILIIIICWDVTYLWNLMLHEARQRVTTYPGTGQVVTTPGASCNVHDWPLVCS